VTDEMVQWPVLLVAGAALGAFYFGGLWLTVQTLLLVRKGRGWILLASFLVRAAVALGGIFVLMGGRWDRLLVCLVGFMAARQLIVRYLTLPEPSTGPPGREADEGPAVGGMDAPNAGATRPVGASGSKGAED